MANGTLVDSNVLLDVMTEDELWFGWSSSALATAADLGPLFINPIVLADVSLRFTDVDELEAALPPADFRRAPIPWDAAFLAGKALKESRERPRARLATLADFLVAAHAIVDDLRLLTRDSRRFRGFFPKLEKIAPDDGSNVVRGGPLGRRVPGQSLIEWVES